MLCENEIENVWVNKKPSASYEEMIPIISDDFGDENKQGRHLQNEDDLLLLSQAVDNVLSNHSNIKVTSLKKNNYSHVYNKHLSSAELENEELMDAISELQLTKILISKKQTELEMMEMLIHNKDLTINNLEKQLRSALDKMLEFVVKYEKYIL